jgi:multidrug resistance protein
MDRERDMSDTDVEVGGLAPSTKEEAFAMSTDNSVHEKDPESGDRPDSSSTEEHDKYMVDWEGDDDPEKPWNWTTAKKWKNLSVISVITLITPLASSMFAPGVPALMHEFKSKNTMIASFVVSIFILGFAIGPMLVAPLCELYGRKWLYRICNVLFCMFTIACAYSKNMAMMMIFRFLAGCAGVAPLTIGAGSIGDLMIAEERGVAMSLFSLGPLLGPIIGPIAGGYVSQDLGWRWVFKIIAIASGASTFAVFLLDETYAPILLEVKAASLRAETGDPLYKSRYATDFSPATVFKHAISRPLKLLLTSPIVFLLSTHLALVYGLLYLLFTTFTTVFEELYGFSTGSVGLTFLGLGVGSIFGVWIVGGYNDRVYIHYEKKNNGIGKPEFRLPLMVWCGLFCPIGLFWYGWTARADIHYIVPIIGTAFVAVGMLSVMIPVQTYLIDAYTRYAASAIAAATIFRSLMGALLPLAGAPMYDKLGIGWGNSLLGFIALAMTPIPWVFWKYGEGIRTRNPIELD